jgi:urease accessory protein
MLRIEGILGNVSERSLADAVHHLAHDGAVEYLFVEQADIGRKRLRLATDRGTDCAISLPRDQTLADGAVLFLDKDKAIVVRVGAERTLRLRPAGSEAALRLGWHAGNLHWRVRFEDGLLVVPLDGPREDYLARLASLIADGDVDVVDDHRH